MPKATMHETERLSFEIPPAELNGIFDEYRQAGASASERSGYGLGLAIARRLVELHGGTLTVESQLGHGATFTLTLPRRE